MQRFQGGRHALRVCLQAGLLKGEKLIGLQLNVLICKRDCEVVLNAALFNYVKRMAGAKPDCDNCGEQDWKTFPSALLTELRATSFRSGRAGSGYSP